MPVGETVLDLATPAPSKKTDTSEPQTARDMSIPLLIGAAVVYLALAAALVRGLTNQRLNARAGLLAVRWARWRFAYCWRSRLRDTAWTWAVSAHGQARWPRAAVEFL